MSSVVVDASVLIAVVVNEPQKAKLIALTQNKSLIAPHSIHWEIGNAFSAMLKRQRIDLAQAQTAISAYMQIPVRFVDIELEKAVDLAGRFNIYAYDAYLIRCALKYQAPLITLDRRLENTAQLAGAKILEVK